VAEQLWRVEQLADFLNTSVPNAYYLIERGRVPGVVRLGRAIRIDPNAVRDWVSTAGAVL
jgi:excisionase family DNA binding protein